MKPEIKLFTLRLPLFFIGGLLKFVLYFTGLWLLTWLFTPKTVAIDNGEIVFLSSPKWLDLKGKESWYFWRPIYRVEWVTGSGPETCDSGYYYHLPTDRQLKEAGYL